MGCRHRDPRAIKRSISKQICFGGVLAQYELELLGLGLVLEFLASARHHEVLSTVPGVTTSGNVRKNPRSPVFRRRARIRILHQGASTSVGLGEI
jgi:hypothetical protein